MKNSWISKDFLYVVFCMAVFALSCSDDDSTSPGGLTGETGVLKISLTDAPAEYDAVIVAFSEVAVHFGEEKVTEENTPVSKTAGEWIIISDVDQEFNLLTLTEGATALLGEAELEEGLYTQLRLILSGAYLVIGEDEYTLDVPSNTLKFVSGFEIIADETTELLVDFDAYQSIHQTGNGRYKLKPTIQLIEITDGEENVIANIE